MTAPEPVDLDRLAAVAEWDADRVTWGDGTEFIAVADVQERLDAIFAELRETRAAVERVRELRTRRRRHNRCGLGDPDVCGHPDCPGPQPATARTDEDGAP